MAGSSIENILEHKPRYKIRGGRHATVVLERVSGSDRTPLTASLVDLAENWAKLWANASIPVGELVELKLAMDGLESEFRGAAEIRWSRPGEGEDWLVACTFRPQIPSSVLDKLVDCGMLEQREESERRNVSLPVTIRWELGESVDSAKLQDYSDGGFCIVTDQAAEPGQRLSMRCEAPDGEPLEIPAKVQWMLKTAEYNLVGCAILLGHDFSCLRALEC